MAGTAAAIWITTAWLLRTADDAKVGTDRAQARVEAVRTGLAAGAGAGAGVGLLLAFRRQAHQEYDTAERRVTELYNAAAEQLGSDKAPVRLTALYTLERLANDNPRHRQTIVNIICAYLRMPFALEPPPMVVTDKELAELAPAERVTAATAASEDKAKWDQEINVRLTAERILTAHLSRTARVQWAAIDLELSGAVLFNFNLTDCDVNNARFLNATFTEGHAFFRRANFSDGALFIGATFTHDAIFDGTIFHHVAVFTSASFLGNAYFSQVSFSSRGPVLRAATFAGDAVFDRAAFRGEGNFREVTFSGRVTFVEATFVTRPVLVNAEVADVKQEHTLPPGWQFESAEGRTGRLVEDSVAAPLDGNRS